MLVKRLRESLPLLLTFSAVLMLGVLFFTFAQADAALSISEAPTTSEQTSH